ncbi:MAG: Gfo/Idh/MocA family oxidoreductase [Armatimonadota bacterium]|nr:MAG: Gfo/Idh/MocA family oxidoreductase [Armatimonadota bacterium]
MSVTAGVIGCGYISGFHFRALDKIGARVKWVCDVDETRARPWVAKDGTAHVTGYEQVVGDPEVDVVFVLTTSSTHKRICLDAIDAGRAVICEKTLTTNADDSLEVVRRAEESGAIFYTSYMKRFIPAVEKARELLPRLGTILSTHVRAYQPWGPLWEAMPSAGLFHTPAGGKSGAVANYGGGILIMGGSHILDLVNFLLGRPRRVYGSVHVPEGRDYDLRAAALLETDHGPVHFDALAHPLRRIGFLRDGWDERIEINGTDGRLEIFSALWDEVDYKASLLVHYDEAAGAATEYRYPPVSPFERAVAFFCGNIERRTQGSQSRLTGYEVDELIATIKRSSDSGSALEVNWRA